MKSVMLSIQPKWVEKICKGEKTLEVRKTRPKIETPFKCYIYCTKVKPALLEVIKKGDVLMSNNKGENIYYEEDTPLFLKSGYVPSYSQKVIGEFVCDRITDISVVVRNCNEDYNHVYHNDECKGSCLTWKELQEYGKGKPLYGWHISDLKIYDKPKELNEFERPCSYKGTCYYCVRAKFESDGTLLCDNKITCPPQSYMFVEDL